MIEKIKYEEGSAGYTLNIVNKINEIIDHLPQEKESDGNLLFKDLCGRLIKRILEFNPDEHDIELNLCGIIEKAKQPAKEVPDIPSVEEIERVVKEYGAIHTSPYRLSCIREDLIAQAIHNLLTERG